MTIIEQQSTPQLRFRNFQVKWSNQKLGNIAHFSKGKGISKADIVDEGSLPCIRYGQLYTDYGEAIDNVISRTDVSPKGMVFSKVNDVIIPASGETQIDIATAACVLIDGVVLGGDLNIIRTEEDGIFLSYYLNGKMKQNIARLAQGISVVHLYSKQLAELILYFPSLPEQQKIASFLTTVDRKIQQLTRKKELLEQYKKGVMQKIFSCKIRFKDEKGKDYPDWEERRLGEIVTFFRTNSFSRNDLNYTDGQIKNIHYGDIHTKFKSSFDINNEFVPFINLDIDLTKLDKEQFCKIGDIVIADASEDYADIGKTIEIKNIANQKIVAGLHTFLGRDLSNRTVVGFKGYLLQTSSLRKQIQRIAQGISVLGISKTNLVKLEFLLPCKEEQSKIVYLLENLDKKIESALLQINATQSFKKGLLQRMFV